MPARVLLACPLLIALLLLGCFGCSTPPEPDQLRDVTGSGPPVEKDYERPLPPGMNALRKLDPAEWPDLTAACSDLAGLDEALARSERWFALPSSKAHFPVSDIDYARARASVTAMRKLLRSNAPAQVAAQMRAQFDCYMSVGCDLDGTVLFTGYYSPVFRASKTRTGEFQHPLYRQPKDLRKDPKTGSPIGGYASRAELEAGRLNPADAFVYLPSKVDAYIIAVNGSARLDLVGGRTMYVGYEAHNGHEYVSIRAELVKDGKIGKRAGLPAIRKFFREYPGEVDEYLRRNPRFVFLRPYDGSSWPSGSLGFKVTTRRTLATDKKIFPRGGLLLVDTTLPNEVGAGNRPFSQWMVDQDTGGAIRAPGRGDIYLGVGDAAEALAGRQAAEGRLYYFFLKQAPVSAE